jgi:hypothetical protein
MSLACVPDHPGQVHSIEQLIGSVEKVIELGKIDQHLRVNHERGFDLLRVGLRERFQFGAQYIEQRGRVAHVAHDTANLPLRQRRFRKRAQIQPDHGARDPGQRFGGNVGRQSAHGDGCGELKCESTMRAMAGVMLSHRHLPSSTHGIDMLQRSRTAF